LLTSKTFAVLFSDHPLALLLLIWRSFNFEIEDGAEMHVRNRGRGKARKRSYMFDTGGKWHLKDLCLWTRSPGLLPVNKLFTFIEYEKQLSEWFLTFYE